MEKLLNTRISIELWPTIRKENSQQSYKHDAMIKMAELADQDFKTTITNMFIDLKETINIIEGNERFLY